MQQVTKPGSWDLTTFMSFHHISKPFNLLIIVSIQHRIVSYPQPAILARREKKQRKRGIGKKLMMVAAAHKCIFGSGDRDARREWKDTNGREDVRCEM